MKSVDEEEFPELFRFIKEDKLEIYYSPYQRSFTIGGKESGLRQEIHFCPWTGKQLPVSLSGEFATMLESRDLSALEPESWPEDWRSEEWWMKAGR